MPDADRVHSSVPRPYRRLFAALSDESVPPVRIVELVISAVCDDLKRTGDVVLQAVRRFGELFEEVKHLPLILSGEGSIIVSDRINRTLRLLSGFGVSKDTLGLFEHAAYHTFDMCVSGRIPTDGAQLYARSLVHEVFHIRVEGHLHLAGSRTIAANHLGDIKAQVLHLGEQLANQLTRISNIDRLRLPPGSKAKLTPDLYDALPLGDGV